MNNYQPFELHCHTNHSDGQMSPKELVERAVERGYSGIAITDHNTSSAVNEVIEEGRKKNLIIIPGIEWTTFWGHIVALGWSAIDWREIRPDNINEILQRGYNKGLVLTLAHPKRYGTPICTGCYMDLPVTEFQFVSAYEVWTQKSPNFLDYNIKALKEYDSLLQKRYRIAAVYGYDWHKFDRQDNSFAATFLGDSKNPCQCIKKGDTYISLGLSIDIKINNKRMPFGSLLLPDEYSFDITIDLHDRNFCKERHFKPQKIVAKGNAIEGGEKSFSLDEKIKIKLQKGYIRFEIIGEERGYTDKTLLLTSPYYVTKGV